MARKTPLTIVRQARALLAKGWCQIHRHRRYGEVDHYCASAALSVAATGHHWRVFPQMKEVYAVLDRLAREADPSTIGDVNPLTAFNDQIGRKQKEVVALFDRAIQEMTNNGSLPALPR